MKRKSFKRYFFLLPAVFMMALIFFFSSREAEESTRHSMLIAYYVVDAGDSLGFIDVSSPEERELYASYVDGVVRKSAHMIEFGILSFTVWFGLIFWTDSRKKLYSMTMGICVFYACTDEIHQMFVRGRYGCARDVLVDSAGTAFVLLLIFGIENAVRDSMYMRVSFKDPKGSE